MPDSKTEPDFVSRPRSRTMDETDSDTASAFELIQLSGPTLSLPSCLDDGLLLGRALDCDLVLADPGVSRHHARLDVQPSPRIDDLGSAAGTYLNEHRIDQPAPLRPGDRLRIGPWIFRVGRRGQPTVGPAMGPTIRTAALADALAAPRLERLLEFSEAINQAGRPEDVLQALADAAHGVSGFDRALIIDLADAGDRPWLASPATRSDDRPSRTLVEQVQSGNVVELCETDLVDASESIVALKIVSALATGIRSGETVRYVLYLDRRSGEAEAHPDTARFCESLARLAELGLARIEQADRLRRQRERIYADLHDDLGARLLNQVYRAPDAAARDEARAMLQDLRDVVSRPSGRPVLLEDLLGEIRSEATERLATAGIALDWPPVELPDVHWTPDAAALLTRSLRELISNVIRHAQPARLQLRSHVSDRLLQFELTHSAKDSDPARWVRGRGLHSLSERATRLGGRIEWLLEDALLKTRLALPLEPERRR